MNTIAGRPDPYIGAIGDGQHAPVVSVILVPSAGRVNVLGRVPRDARMANAREIGVVFGQRSQLWWDLPVRDAQRAHLR